MTVEALTFIKDELESVNINYEFGEYTSAITYPYFVGEYESNDSENEDGLEDSTFLLTGFSRGSWLLLEQQKDIIKRLFRNKTAILESGSGIAVFYNGSSVIPTGDAELKRIEIRLQIKYWRADT